MTRQVSSPDGGTVYDAWKKTQNDGRSKRGQQAGSAGESDLAEAHVGDLGSGSDFTPFFQHLGVPSTDVGSEGPYGVYHSVFDNYNWFIKFADPTFVYEQQMARIFGLEILHMADTDVLPYDYGLYGKEVVSYVEGAQKKAAADKLPLDFVAAKRAAARFQAAGSAIRTKQTATPVDPAALNRALREAENALLDPAGLPKRAWYKHTIYSPGEFTGYAAVVIPGVTEALDAPDAARAQQQLARLTDALNRAAEILEKAAQSPA